MSVDFDCAYAPLCVLCASCVRLCASRLASQLPKASIAFNFNSSSSELDLSDAKTAREVIGLRMRGVVDPAGMMAALQARPDAELQLRNQYAPMTPAETLEYYSQTPYRFGKYVGKHGLFPVGGEDWKKRGEVKVDGKEQDTRVLGRWLKEWYAEDGREQVYEWRWQLCEDLKEQPVEFAGELMWFMFFFKDFLLILLPRHEVGSCEVPVPDSGQASLPEARSVEQRAQDILGGQHANRSVARTGLFPAHGELEQSATSR